MGLGPSQPSEAQNENTETENSGQGPEEFPSSKRSGQVGTVTQAAGAGGARSAGSWRIRGLRMLLLRLSGSPQPPPRVPCLALSFPLGALALEERGVTSCVLSCPVQTGSK